MNRSSAVTPLPLRLAWFAGIMLTAAATSIWRTAAGHQFRPGLFTVIFLPLSITLFVVMDRAVGFGPGEWLAVAGVVVAHLVLSVPGSGGPLYYRGSHLVRPDHFVHLFAGGLVAWLSCDLVWRVRPDLPRLQFAIISFGLALTFGVMKETTDFLSVRAAGLPHDTFDSVADFCANAVGATAAVWWWLRRDRQAPREPRSWRLLR